MNYAKKWVPPVIPVRDDLPTWKALFKDVHQNILAAGLVQSSTPGQLDFDSVVELPADGTYAGFIEYEFTDSLQATLPIVIKLEFGCGEEGLRTNSSSGVKDRTPNIRSTVISGGVESMATSSPQAVRRVSTANGNSDSVSLGLSHLLYAPELGFLAICYGAGSRNKPFASTTGGYYGATLSLFVQRATLSDGTPTGAGVAVYGPGLNVDNYESNLWSSGTIDSAFCQFIGADGVKTPKRRSMAARVGGTGVPGGYAEDIMVQQVFYEHEGIKPFPWLVSYDAALFGQGTEFELEVYPGVLNNFVALGNETSMGVDEMVGQRAGLAILFE